MKGFLAFLFIVLLPSILWSQSVYVVNGEVLSENGKALPGASVLYRNQSTGTVTDVQGYFKLAITELPAYVEIRFIGYKTHYVSLSASDFGENQSTNLSIKLIQLTEELEAVTVTGEAYENFFTHSGFSVLDFEFVDENILLLLKNKRTYKLVLMSSTQDSLAHLKLTKIASGLVADCLNQQYVTTEDSVLALSFANNKIQVVGALELNYYNKSIKPCVASNTHSLYYNFYKYNNQLLEIYQSPKDGGTSNKIKELVDREDAYSKSEYGHTAQSMLSGNSPVGSNLTGLALFKKGFERMAWFKHTMAKPIYNPLFASAEGAILFNHFCDSVQRLNSEGVTVESFHITHHHLKEFDKQVIKDKLSNKFYVVFKKGGTYRLGLLSTVDFSVESEIVIQNHSFLNGLKVRNGVAYFLNRKEDDLNRFKLYRQQLR